ncbi:hypothetical protein HDE_04493 [Halotydeus destructor]|nr:hypothetical protein HDE_04493 [Halotydeus destructor]
MFALSRIRSLSSFLVTMATIGISGSALFILTISWTLATWSADGNTYLQLVFFLASVGYTLAPVMTKPYLLNDPTFNVTDAQKRDYYITNSNINVPLDICAILASAVLILVIADIALSKKKSAEAAIKIDKEEKVLASSTSLSGTHATLIVFLGSIMACCSETFSQNTGNYLMTYLTTIEIEKSHAADIVSVYGLALAVGRLLGIAVAMKIREGVMLTFCLTLSMIGNILTLFAGSNVTLIMIGIVVLSLGKAAMSGSLYAVIDRRVKVTDFVSGIVHFAATFGPIVYPLISGPMIDKTPTIFLYINISFLIVCMLSFAGIVLVVQKR